MIHAQAAGVKVSKAILIKAPSEYWPPHQLCPTAAPLGRDGLRLSGLDTVTLLCSRVSFQLSLGLSPGFWVQVLDEESDTLFPLGWTSAGAAQANFILLTLSSHHSNFTIFFCLFNLISLKSASSDKFKDILCSW